MDFNYSSDNVDVNDILHSAQLITNAFSKTLEDNNCLLSLTIGLHQEIDNSIKDLEDFVENISDTNNNLENGIELTAEDVLNNIESITKDLKDQCFKCKLELPSLDFDMDLDALLSTLKAQIKLFKDIFKFDKLDFCQAAYSMQDTCVPDILRLITLLLTAFVSIMSLKKLSNISITAFIKGVLSTLLSKIMQAVKITVNIGGTNISCLINALKEIAMAIPTQENIAAQLSQQEALALNLIQENADGSTSSTLKTSMVSSLTETLTDNLNTLQADLNYFDTSISTELEESFKLITDVIDKSVEEVNDYIQSLLNFQTYFECETKRSGMDVEDAIRTINNLIQVLNTLSALALSMVKKNIREEACRSKSSINSLSKSEIDDLQIKDLLQDMNQQVVDIISSTENALEVIIYDKPLETALPKIDLLDCSIDDFIEAHRLPNIINVAKKQIAEEDSRKPSTDSGSTFIFKRPSGEQTELIKNIVDLIYTKPEDEEVDNEGVIKDTIDNPIGSKGISDLLKSTIDSDPSQQSLACKSVEDVLNILNKIKR